MLSWQRSLLHLINADKLTTPEGVPGLGTEMKPLMGHVGGGQSTWPFPSETFDPRCGIFHGEAVSHQGERTREMYI